jgi:thymidylate synthase (FAD)
MAGFVIEVKAPIFVYRQWHRHRMQSYNEMSARYMPLPDENYIPSVERLMMSSSKNKQAGKAKGADALTLVDAEVFRNQLLGAYAEAEEIYQNALNAGVPKELARIHLPVARYSVMRAQALLLNWLKFLKLRLDPHAQWEVRQYALAVAAIVEEKFPRTWELFAEAMS